MSGLSPSGGAEPAWRPLVIAIDGPAGAGKSTVGKASARRLGLEYLDTGAMYRAVAFAALRRGIPVTDDAAVADARSALELSVVGGRCRRRRCRRDRGDPQSRGHRGGRARSPPTRRCATSSAPGSEQWADERGGGVIEGRDIGTVVFPDATLKLFVTASPRVRCRAPRRRARRRRRRGGGLDRRARPPRHERADGPLRAAEGAARRRHHPACRSTRSSSGSSSAAADVTKVVDASSPAGPASRALYYVVRARGHRLHPAVDAHDHRRARAHPAGGRVRAGAGPSLQHGHADRGRA